MINFKKQIPAKKAFRIILFTLILPTLIMIIGAAILIFNALNNEVLVPAQGVPIQKEHTQFMKYDGIRNGEEIGELLKKIEISNSQNEDRQIEVCS